MKVLNTFKFLSKIPDIYDNNGEIYKKGYEYVFYNVFARNIVLENLKGFVNFENLGYCCDVFLKKATGLYAPSLEYVEKLIVPHVKNIYLPELQCGDIYAVHANIIKLDNTNYNGTIYCNKNALVIADQGATIEHHKKSHIENLIANCNVKVK